MTPDVSTSGNRIPGDEGEATAPGQEFGEHLKARDKSLAPGVIFTKGDPASRESRELVPATGRPLNAKRFDLVGVRREILGVLEAEPAGDQDG